jgi:hypothetical protein
MRNRFLILSVVMATLFACSSDSMSTDDMNKPVGERATPVNFKVKNLMGNYEFGPDVVTSIDCDAFNLNADGEGIVSHLGKSAIHEEWCWDPTSPFVVGERYNTFTAANGDELWGEIVSIDYPEAGSNNFDIFVEVVNFVGGTGRFEDVGGTITQTVVTSPDETGTAGTFIYNSEGTLIYNTK